MDKRTESIDLLDRYSTATTNEAFTNNKTKSKYCKESFFLSKTTNRHYNSSKHKKNYRLFIRNSKINLVTKVELKIDKQFF